MLWYAKGERYTLLLCWRCKLLIMSAVEHVLRGHGELSDVSFRLEPYVLSCRTTFGTAHSSTMKRTNALVTVSMCGVQGFGEAGLPPKKAGVYYCDYGDVLQYFDTLRTFELCTASDPFASLPSIYFPEIRAPADRYRREMNTVRGMLNAIDSARVACALSFEESRTAAMPFETAVLDAAARILEQPLYKVIGVDRENAQQKVAFYTVAMSEDEEEVRASVRLGLAYTPNLKFKMGNDLDFGKKLMLVADEVFREVVPEDVRRNALWCIDANAAWTPSTAREALELIRSIDQRIYMIEQPFPVVIDASEEEDWKEIKDSIEREGSLVFADESMSDASDVDRLKPLVHGLNVKLEKAGGIRGALAAMEHAREQQLKIWTGIMLTSVLCTNTAAQIIAHADVGGDLDGALLITDESQGFEGGFEWGGSEDAARAGRVLWVDRTPASRSWGVGVWPKGTS